MCPPAGAGQFLGPGSQKAQEKHKVHKWCTGSVAFGGLCGWMGDGRKRKELLAGSVLGFLAVDGFETANLGNEQRSCRFVAFTL